MTSRPLSPVLLVVFVLCGSALLAEVPLAPDGDGYFMVWRDRRSGLS